MGETGLDSFLVGFRLGAKMIFDTFCSDDAPFESYLKEASFRQNVPLEAYFIPDRVY